MKIQIDSTETIETDTLSIDELRELKRRVDTTIDKIEHQLNLAKANKIETGAYADPKWYANAAFALKRRRKVAQLLQQLIGHRNKSIRLTGRTVANHFMDICRETMSPDIFAKFLSAAERRKAIADVESLEYAGES